MSSDAPVAMLDHADKTLHRPATGRGHLVSRCGLPLGSTSGRVTVGPTKALWPKADRLCPECWSITCPKCGRTSRNPDDVEQRYCGACHVYLDQLLAFRVFVDGQLADERWVDPMEPPTGQTERMATEQRAMCEGADAAGLAWRLEIYDPSEDRTVRISSSEAAAAAPPPPGQPRHLAGPEPVDITEPGEMLRWTARFLGYE